MLLINERQNKIINILSKSQDPITGKHLANQLKTSVKTIRNDIKAINQINQQDITIQSKSGVGYSLNTSNIKKEFRCNRQTNNKFELLKKLIDKPINNLYELSDELFVSESTLMNWVNELNEIIIQSSPKLKIRRNSNELIISGSENERRHIFNLFLNQELRINRLSLDKYYDFFDFVDLKILLSEIKNLYKEEQIKLNDFSMISFVLHIAVLLERIHNESYISLKKIKMDNTECIQYSEVLKDLLEKKYKIKLPDQEIAYIYHLYIGELKINDPSEKNNLNEIIESILIQINKTFYIDFSKDLDLPRYLKTHLEGLYQRFLANKFLVNPLTNDIKNKYPFIYNISVYASSLFQQKLNFSFPDDEIAYIALHFLSSYEIIQSEQSKNILLISPYSAGGKRLIRTKLNKIEKYSINIQFISPFENIDKHLNNIDLILVEDDIQVNTDDVPIYTFKDFPTDDDLHQITSILSKNRKKRKDMILSKYARKTFFFPHCSFNSPDEIIKFLCLQLKSKKIVPANYLDLVLERENISSTAYANNHAIPHAIQRVSKRNTIAICLLDKPLNWSGKKVRIVLLLALKAERSNDFEDLFGEISVIFDDKSFVNKLSRMDTYDDFIRLCRSKLYLK